MIENNQEKRTDEQTKVEVERDALITLGLAMQRIGVELMERSSLKQSTRSLETAAHFDLDTHLTEERILSGFMETGNHLVFMSRLVTILSRYSTR